MALIIGHRGAANHVTENTIPSFERGIQLGADMIEMDVRVTKDGVPIVFHDASLARLNGTDKNVALLTLAEIKQHKIETEHEIPTLEDVIKLSLGRAGLAIELKSPGSAVAVSELIDRYKIQNNILVLSFSVPFLRKMREINPKTPLCLLFRRYSNNIFNPTAKKIWEHAKELELEYIGPRVHLISRGLIKRAHDAGIKVLSYSVKDKKVGQRIIKWGVDAVVTDNPEWFLDDQAN